MNVPVCHNCRNVLGFNSLLTLDTTHTDVCTTCHQLKTDCILFNDFYVQREADRVISEYELSKLGVKV